MWEGARAKEREKEKAKVKEKARDTTCLSCLGHQWATLRRSPIRRYYRIHCASSGRGDPKRDGFLHNRRRCHSRRQCHSMCPMCPMCPKRVQVRLRCSSHRWRQYMALHRSPRDRNHRWDTASRWQRPFNNRRNPRKRPEKAAVVASVMRARSTPPRRTAAAAHRESVNAPTRCG